MRITKEQAEENREHVLNTASKLFLEKGYDGIAVADLMQAAGFTHGGFYNHFNSKEALARAATVNAFQKRAAAMAKAKNLEATCVCISATFTLTGPTKAVLQLHCQVTQPGLRLSSNPYLQTV